MANPIVFYVTQGSAAFLALSFTDENGAAVIPVSIKWSLTDEKGNVVNGRTNVIVASPTNPYTVCLDAADTEVMPSPVVDNFKRVLTMQFTYVSSTTGAPSPCHGNFEYWFGIQPLVRNP